VLERLRLAGFLWAAVSLCSTEAALIFANWPDQTAAAHSYNRALRYRGSGQYRAAIEELKKTIEQDPSFSRAYSRLQSLYHQVNEPEAGRRYVQSLLEKEPRNPYWLFAAGLLSRQERKTDEAESSFRRSVELAPGFVPAHKELVEIAREKGQLEALARSFGARSEASQPARAAAEFGLGYIYHFLGKADTAIPHLNNAIQLDPNLLEPRYVLFLIHQERDTEKALTACDAILERATASGDLEWRERTSGFMGSIYADLGEAGKAQEYFEQSLQIAREIGDRIGEQAYLAHVGVVYSTLGKHSQALIAYEQALKIARELGDRLSEGRDIGLIGDVHSELGNYAKAVYAYLQAVTIAKSVNDRPSEAHQLASLGSIYALLGDDARALETVRTAFAIAREINDPWMETRFLQILGYIHEESGRQAEAMEVYEQALAIARKAGDRIGEATQLADLARVQARSGDSHRALAHYEQSLKIARGVGAITVEGAALNGLGEVRQRMGQHGQAELDHRKALAIGEQTRMPRIIWQANAGLAATLEKQGRRAEAIGHYRQAVESIERVRGKLEVAEEKAGFFENKIEVYKSLIGLLIASAEKEPQKQYAAEAFHFVERARARAFLDLMAESKLGASRGVDPELLSRQQAIQSRIARIQSNLIKQYSEEKPPARETVRPLEVELERADDDYQDLRREIRRRHPRYGDLRYPEPARLEEVQRLLGDNKLLLEYSLGQQASHLFAVTNKECIVARLPSAQTITDRVRRLREAIARPDRRAVSSYVTDARWLYQELIRPASKLAAGKQEVVIVADGILHYLPFEVLLGPAGTAQPQAEMSKLPYLITEHAISYVSSASVMISLLRDRDEKPASPKRFLAYADASYEYEPALRTDRQTSILRGGIDDGSLSRLERLRHSRREVEGIAQLYPRQSADLFLGDQATEENVKAQGRLGDYSTIHFAVHGLLNEQKPQFSGLVLKLPQVSRQGKPTAPPDSHLTVEDGLLQVYEIFNLTLNADLVVLSACETGLGKEDKGEGLVGLTRAFLYAGSSSVIVSLWKVTDASTAELMIRFHQHLRDTGKAEALRRTQLELIRQARYSHPYYWAPFVLVGRSD
jgi:CHAT domain-containing protein/Tfp pilus assembly protein PilF